MKIKRFFSKDMRGVIRMVREELGSEAIIHANQQVDGGVEMLASVDDEQFSLQSQETDRHSVTPFGEQNQSPIPESAYRDVPVTDPLIDSLSEEKNPFGASRSSFNASTTSESAQTGSKNELDLNEFSKHVVEAAIETESASGKYTTSKQDTSARKVSFFQNANYKAQTESLFYDLESKKNPEMSRMSPAGDSSLPVTDNVLPSIVSIYNELLNLRSHLEYQSKVLSGRKPKWQPPIRAKLISQLSELEFFASQAEQIVDQVDDGDGFAIAWQSAMNYISDRLPIDSTEFASGGIYALLGPTGAGKTSAVAKLAARFALRYGRNNIGIITIDCFRIGAYEQLSKYARVFDIPILVAANKQSLDQAIRAFSRKKYIFIDSAGLNFRDSKLNRQFELIAHADSPINNVLVVPSTSHRNTLHEVIRGFSKLKLHSSIITKIDETTNLGGSLANMMKHELPISFICDGQKIPDAMHSANAQELVNQCVLIARTGNQPSNQQNVDNTLARSQRDI